MEKLIKILLSPFNSNLEVVGDIVLTPVVPYSEKEVTIEINPEIHSYTENQDQPGVQIRQLMVTTHTDQTQTLKFDFTENNIHEIEINDKKYNIRLMQIGKEKSQGDDFTFFEFLVKWGVNQ